MHTSHTHIYIYIHNVYKYITVHHQTCFLCHIYYTCVCVEREREGGREGGRERQNLFVCKTSRPEALSVQCRARARQTAHSQRAAGQQEVSGRLVGGHLFGVGNRGGDLKGPSSSGFSEEGRGATPKVLLIWRTESEISRRLSEL